MAKKDAAVAAIEFSLKTDEGLQFLRCWLHGEFDAIRREWPDCPEDCFLGADPSLKPEELVRSGYKPNVTKYDELSTEDYTNIDECLATLVEQVEDYNHYGTQPKVPSLDVRNLCRLRYKVSCHRIDGPIEVSEVIAKVRA